MDVEFHYYITYLLAARAGFIPEQARKIAYACQGVDDNKIYCRINDNCGNIYENCISQTIDIKQPAEELCGIYQTFHFVPWCGIEGDGAQKPSPRKDGQETDINLTAPNNLLAQKMMKNAFDIPETAEERLYRIGIAAHAYSDTWAHQNFTGLKAEINSVPTNTNKNYSVKSETVEYNVENIIAIGHGAFAHKPDIPNLVWSDPRLTNSIVSNRERFIDAASHIFRFFVKDRDPKITNKFIVSEIKKIREDLDNDIGSESSSKTERIANYRKRASTAEYGGEVLPLYDEDTLLWADEAVEETWSGLVSEVIECCCIETEGFFQKEPLVCKWKDPLNYHKTEWYHFLEAIKQHKDIGVAIMREYRKPKLR